MKRREWLEGAGMLAGLTAAAPWWRLAQAARATPAVPLAALDALPAGVPLPALPKLRNESRRAGWFKATLHATPAEVEFIPGRRTAVWAYNGSVPAPLIEATAGDVVEIAFENRLPQPTTVHWHGLPVPPDQDGNPHDPVAPGAWRVYRFTLPRDAAGTYWYHPHPHGDTPEQVFRGLAGPFVVRSPADLLAALPERHLFVSDLRLDAHGAIPPNDDMDWMNGREGQYALVNGKRLPRLSLAAGGRERWRIWNACSARYLRLALPGCELTLVGTDGGPIERPRTVSEWLLAPAQRVELLVTAQRDGATQLIAESYDRGKMGGAPVDPALPLLEVTLRAPRTPPAPLPARLRTVDAFGAARAVQRVRFSEEMSMTGGKHEMRFLVNGKSFDMQRVDLTSRVGAVEQWEIFNDSDMDHPFHLHGSQFVVIETERDGVVTREPFAAYRDTVNLVPRQTVRFKVVQHQAGLRMFHCHLLEHEAFGMMGTLQVVA